MDSGMAFVDEALRIGHAWPTAVQRTVARFIDVYEQVLDLLRPLLCPFRLSSPHSPPPLGSSALPHNLQLAALQAGCDPDYT